MVHARVPEVYVHFELMYTIDHIFPVIPIKNLINEDGDPTTPHKLATGTKPSVSHVRVLFCPCVVRKATVHVETKTLNMRHQAQKRVLRNLRGNTVTSRERGGTTLARAHTGTRAPFQILRR